MENAISLIISMAAYWIASMMRKTFTDRFGGTAASRHLYNAVGSLVSAAVLLIWGGFGQLSIFTLLLGIAFGIITAVQQITHLKALETGSLAYTTVIISLSMLIPALSGALIWGEQIGLVQVLGIVLMVACLILSVDTSKDTQKRKATMTWLFFSIASFLCVGAIGVMQKWHQSTEFKGELNAFLVVAFVISFVYSGLMYLVLRVKCKTSEKADESDQKSKDGTSVRRTVALAIGMMVLAGICVAANNKLNLYLSGVIDSAIFFPLVNGGGLIITTVSAFLLFREKLSRRQWIGLATGIVAVLLLCLG